MRDRPYDKQKPPGTYRMALTGASHSMGTGVEDDEVFDNVVEDRLNREAGPDGPHYEILNFSVGGYGPVERLADMDQRILDFDLDALIYVGVNDIRWVVKNLVDAARGGRTVPYPYLADAIREAGLGPSTSVAEGFQKLEPRREELLRWVYNEIVRRCRERGIVPIAAFIPQTKYHLAPETQAEIARQLDIAREAGFTVIDMRDAYDGVEYSDLWIAPWDGHPNAKGHRLLAEKLYEGLKREMASEPM